MSYALYSPKLLVRDIENFSKENSNALITKENKLISILKRIANTIAKLIQVNIQLKQASKVLRAGIKRDYNIFMQSEHREKEDMLIKWERLARTLKEHSTKMPPKSTFLSRGIVNKSVYIVETVNHFVDDLRNVLYPNADTPLSQEYLKELSEKFKHLPQDVLDDITSQEYSECV